MGDGGSGGRVEKVEVSFDEGKTWHEAQITEREHKDPKKKTFSWVQWRYDLAVSPSKNTETVSVMVRCHDSTGHTQDKTLEEIFNLSGTMVNHPMKIEFNYDVI